MKCTLPIMLTVAALGTSVLAQERPGIDPKAIEIATASSEFLASEPQISVGWFITYDVIEDGREKRTTAWTGESALLRGEGYRSTSVQGDVVRDYLFDGTTFTTVFTGEAEYGQIDAAGSFEQLNAMLLQDYDIALPLADVFDHREAPIASRRPPMPSI